MIKLVFGSFISFLLFTFAEKQNYNYVEVIEDQSKILTESINRGKIIYEQACIRCHMAEGEGHPKFYPPLANSDWLATKRKESIHSVKFGLKGLITVNGTPFKRNMPNPGLENEEIADVMNFIMNSWGNTQKKMVTGQEVAELQK